MAERIQLTEKQKGLLVSLTQQQMKLQEQYDELGKRVNELVDFILDANGVDIKQLVTLELEGNTIVYTFKVEPVSEVAPPLDEPDTAVV